jgi:hypothetical protein
MSLGNDEPEGGGKRLLDALRVGVDVARKKRQTIEAVRARRAGKDRAELRGLLEQELDRDGIACDPIWVEETLDELESSETERAQQMKRSRAAAVRTFGKALGALRRERQAGADGVVPAALAALLKAGQAPEWMAVPGGSLYPSVPGVGAEKRAVRLGTGAGPMLEPGRRPRSRSDRRSRSPRPRFARSGHSVRALRCSRQKDSHRVRRGGARRQPRAPPRFAATVRIVYVRLGRAWVELLFGRGDTLEVALTREAGRWRVSSPAFLSLSTCPAIALAECQPGSKVLRLATIESGEITYIPKAVRLGGARELREYEAGSLVAEQSGCLACHRIGGEGHRGPGQALTHVGSQLDDQLLRQALIDPQAPMPSFKHLPHARLAPLVRFLALLR